MTSKTDKDCPCVVCVLSRAVKAVHAEEVPFPIVLAVLAEVYGANIVGIEAQEEHSLH